MFGDERMRVFRGLDNERALMLPDAPDAASSLAYLRVQQAVRLHALAGDRQGQWSVTVNGRWRVTFRFDGADALDVAVEDYHRG